MLGNQASIETSTLVTVDLDQAGLTNQIDSSIAHASPYLNYHTVRWQRLRNGPLSDVLNLGPLTHNDAEIRVISPVSSFRSHSKVTS